MVSVILPRPVVSTFSPGIGANPPAICFSLMAPGSGAVRKDTLNDIQARGEFAVNIVSGDLEIYPGQLRPIGRMGAPTHTRTSDRFKRERPKI